MPNCAGLVYDTDCRTCDVAAKHRTWLLDAPHHPTDPALIAHIRAGEADGVHRGYKCSIRKPWWSTPSLWVPDLFLLRQIHLAPRLTVNAAAATCTDTVHRVRIARQLDPTALATVFHNSATFAFAEIMGRSYGGGILELEPAEAEQLPIPPPDYASAELAEDVDLLLKANETEKALDLVDARVLIDGLGLSRDVVAQCRCGVGGAAGPADKARIAVSVRESTITVLADWQAPDPAQDSLRHAVLAFVLARADACLRECVPGHITASALVLDDTGAQVLLTLHPRLGRWVQLGGHCEDDDADIVAAALREATEESGVDGLRIEPELVAIHVHPVTCSLGVPTRHLDLQFVAHAPAGAQIALSDESDDLRWWPIDALAARHRSRAGAIWSPRGSHVGRVADAAVGNATPRATPGRRAAARSARRCRRRHRSRRRGSAPAGRCARRSR